MVAQWKRTADFPQARRGAGRNARRDARAFRGFTLIEVLLVIVILGMLATVAIVAISGTREGARIDITKRLIEQVENQLETYSMHMGHYPTEEEGGLKALVSKPAVEDEKLADQWRGPYLKQEPRDPWGHALRYEQVSVDTKNTPGAKPFHVWSFGPDGQDGTADDIKNWSDEGR